MYFNGVGPTCVTHFGTLQRYPGFVHENRDRPANVTNVSILHRSTKICYFKKIVRRFNTIIVFFKLRAYCLTISVSSVQTQKKGCFNTGNI